MHFFAQSPGEGEDNGVLCFCSPTIFQFFAGKFSLRQCGFAPDFFLRPKIRSIFFVIVAFFGATNPLQQKMYIPGELVRILQQFVFCIFLCLFTFFLRCVFEGPWPNVFIREGALDGGHKTLLLTHMTRIFNFQFKFQFFQRGDRDVLGVWPPLGSKNPKITKIFLLAENTKKDPFPSIAHF